MCWIRYFLPLPLPLAGLLDATAESSSYEDDSTSSKDAVGVADVGLEDSLALRLMPEEVGGEFVISKDAEGTTTASIDGESTPTVSEDAESVPTPSTDTEDASSASKESAGAAIIGCVVNLVLLLVSEDTECVSTTSKDAVDAPTASKDALEEVPSQSDILLASFLYCQLLSKR